MVEKQTWKCLECRRVVEDRIYRICPACGSEPLCATCHAQHVIHRNDRKGEDDLF